MLPRAPSASYIAETNELLHIQIDYPFHRPLLNQKSVELSKFRLNPGEVMIEISDETTFRFWRSTVLQNNSRYESHKKLRDLSLRANYTDRGNAACR
jgi:hypothetical protein